MPIKRLVWATDIHLNFLKQREIQNFEGLISEQRPDALLVGGDIAEALTIESYLTKLEDELTCPVYFVLGNHDLYRGSIAGVRAEMGALIGQNGWADGRLVG